MNRSRAWQKLLPHLKSFFSNNLTERKEKIKKKYPQKNKDVKDLHAKKTHA